MVFRISICTIGHCIGSKERLLVKLAVVWIFE